MASSQTKSVGVAILSAIGAIVPIVAVPQHSCQGLRVLYCDEGEPNVMEGGAEDLAVAMAAVGAMDSNVDRDVDAELENVNPGTPEALSVLSVLVHVPNVDDWKLKPPEEFGLLFSFPPVVVAFVVAVPKPNDPKEGEDDVALAADGCFGAEEGPNVKKTARSNRACYPVGLVLWLRLSCWVSIACFL